MTQIEKVGSYFKFNSAKATDLEILNFICWAERLSEVSFKDITADDIEEIKRNHENSNHSFKKSNYLYFFNDIVWGLDYKELNPSQRNFVWKNTSDKEKLCKITGLKNKNVLDISSVKAFFNFLAFIEKIIEKKLNRFHVSDIKLINTAIEKAAPVYQKLIYMGDSPSVF
jgi:hypothetical protein